MSDTPVFREEFIEQAEAIVLDNLSNEQFGVSELAQAMNMSRSNLLRKLKKHTGQSASQFIRQIRLKKGKELLQNTTLTVSEISYQVGFGSTTYFIKCFREQYGHPPGESRSIEIADESPEPGARQKFKWLPVALVLLVSGVIIAYFALRKPEPAVTPLEKSIAVLPFKNESTDSSNLYFVNGLMESTLTNLQKIEDLRVISRTSVERYRDSEMGIPEIARELNVNYIVEGSGQKVGDQVSLNIQLIEAYTDQHIWAEQYTREVVDIFTLQNEIARNIANAIEAIVTPDELEQIEKIPTEDMVAYDYYLQALDPYYSRTKEGLETAIPLFEKAIEQDPSFALAYADIAISYYFLDMFLAEKLYTDQINNYADKALLYDSKLTESLIAKALYYNQIGEYRLAVPHLEKALEYNPNSSAVIQILSDMYARLIPNTAKYLEYALKGIQLDIAANDSTTRSYVYLHLSNALVQSGFVEEAVKYINLSLDFNPENYFSPYVKAMIIYARDEDLGQTRDLLLREWQKDTTRLDILQEVAKFYFYMEDYENAFTYYEKFVRKKEEGGLYIFPYEDAKIGMVYEKMGYQEEANEFFEAYAGYCERDESIYKSVSTAVSLTHEGKYDEAIEQLKTFATNDNYQYWMLLFLDKDPLLDPLKSHPEYHKVIKRIENRFWENQANLKESLAGQGLL